jgi:hypothetical protein
MFHAHSNKCKKIYKLFNIKKETLHIEKWNQIKKMGLNLIQSNFRKNSKNIILSRHFLDQTNHLNNDSQIDITSLLNYYNIPSNRLLTSLYTNVYLKKISKLPDKDRKAAYDGLIYDFHHIYVSKSAQHILENNNFNITNINNIPINTKFRKKMTQTQILNVDEFDKYHGEGSLYSALLEMVYYKFNFTGYDSIAYELTMINIKNTCNEINKDKALLLQDIFINNTRHFYSDTEIDITNLLNKYNITSDELLFYMYKHNLMYDIFQFNPVVSFDLAKEILYKTNYINTFRKNKDEPQYLNIKKYDNKNHKSLYYCLISLLNDKL